MFSVDNDMTILITRGDTAVISITAVVEGESNYVFQPDEVLRFKVFEKKNCDNVILEVDFSVEEETEQVDLVLTEQHTTIGGIINKPVDYWYEVELNPLTNPQTIIGYDNDGPKILRLYPEGKEREPIVPKPEELKTVDSELDVKSTNPIENQAVARAIINIQTTMGESEKINAETFEETEKKITDEVNQRSRAEQRIDTELAVLRGRISLLTSLPEGSTKLDAEVIDGRVDFTGRTHNTAGDSVRNQFRELFSVVGCGKNLFNINDPDVALKTMFDSTGELITNNNYFTSGYIPVEEGKTYYSSYLNNSEIRSIYIRAYAYYDINKTLVSVNTTTVANAGLTIPTDSNIKYIRITTNANGSDYQFEANKQTDYEPYYLTYKVNECVVKSSIPVNIINNKSIIKSSATLNLLDGVITGQQYIDTTGELVKNTIATSSNLIWIKGYDHIVIQRNNNSSGLPTSTVFFNEDKEFLYGYNNKSGGNFPEGTITTPYIEPYGKAVSIPIPDGAYYVGVSIGNDTSNEFMIYGVVGEYVTPQPIPYQSYMLAYRHKQEILPTERYIKSYFNGKKLVTIGDSITAPSINYIPWGNQIASMFNMDYVNYGIGASEIAVNKTDSPYNPMSVRYTEMDDDADLIIVAGGTNDWAHNTSTIPSDVEYVMGTFGDTETTTFYGALDTLCKGLLSKYAGKNIMFMTPIKRISGTKNYYDGNGNGNTLEDYANAIKKVCAFYGIPVLDMFNECTINPIISEIAEAYIPDGTHPNYEGHKIMARQIAGFISKLANEFDYN